MIGGARRPLGGRAGAVFVAAVGGVVCATGHASGQPLAPEGELSSESVREAPVDPPAQEEAPPDEQPATGSEAIADPFVTRAQEGLAHFQGRRYTEALVAFDLALLHEAPAPERATVEFNAAACHFELGRYDLAEQRFLRSAALDPTLAPLARANAGMASLRAGRLADARRHWQSVEPNDQASRDRADELGKKLEQAEAEARIRAADSPPTHESATPRQLLHDPSVRLPQAGIHGWLSLGSGYDTNAAQSGVGDTLGTATTTVPQGSPFVSALASCHWTRPLGHRVAARLAYAGDWLGMFMESVRDLTLQGHELGGYLYLAAADHWLLRVGASGGPSLSGLQEVQLMTLDSSGDGRATWDPDGPGVTELEIRVTGSQGFGAWDYLSGLGVRLGLEQHFEWPAFEVALGPTFRYYGIGHDSWELDADDLPACTIDGARAGGQGPAQGPRSGQGTGAEAAPSDCGGQTYVIPLAYVAPGAGMELVFFPVGQWSLGTFGGYEYRRYTEESTITSVPESAKRRQDHRWRIEARSELPLDRDAHFSILAEYRALISRSNVAYDADDPDHALDYDHRSFVQHVVEGGVLLAF